MSHPLPAAATLNVNLFAGPCVGKSVTAAGLFVELKMRGIHAELVTEFAKELVYDGTIDQYDQLEIITEQHRRQNRLQGKAQVVITDAGVPLSLAYVEDARREELGAYVRELMAPWKNLNVMLHRDLRQGYEPKGRYQSQEQAIAFHENRLVPLLRAFYGSELIDCAVETAVQDLAAMVQLRIGGRAPRQPHGRPVPASPSLLPEGAVEIAQDAVSWHQKACVEFGQEPTPDNHARIIAARLELLELLQAS